MLKITFRFPLFSDISSPPIYLCILSLSISVSLCLCLSLSLSLSLSHTHTHTHTHTHPQEKAMGSPLMFLRRVQQCASDHRGSVVVEEIQEQWIADPPR